jgi:predicted aldo/keto reductase-like oxidoreductase
MQYRIDTKTGNSLSVLGFGCMRFPQSLGSIDQRKAEALVLTAIGRGVNYFDTAYLYPGSEETVGNILAHHRLRDKVYLATKLPLLICRGHGDFDKFFHKSRERLKTDHIDYYLMHMITDFSQWEQCKKWGIREWIAEKKAAGQIKQIGFSFHGSLQEFLKVLADYDWELCQLQYNYSDENFQAGITGVRAAAQRMPVIIMEPLLGGKLANGLPQEAVDLFKKANPAVSPAAWALRWLWDQPEPTVVLSGMSSLKQLEENLALADDALVGMLHKAEHETVRRVRACFNEAYKIKCTGCNYCMPCPRGVNIPGSFAAYNTSYTLGFILGMQQYITSTAPSSEKVSSPCLCVRCGACEHHCPQALPIIHNLMLVRKRMEPWWFRTGRGIVRRFLGRKKIT